MRGNGTWSRFDPRGQHEHPCPLRDSCRIQCSKICISQVFATPRRTTLQPLMPAHTWESILRPPRPTPTLESSVQPSRRSKRKPPPVCPSPIVPAERVNRACPTATRRVCGGACRVVGSQERALQKQLALERGCDAVRGKRRMRARGVTGLMEVTCMSGKCKKIKSYL